MIKVKRIPLLTVRNLTAEDSDLDWKVYSKDTQAYGYVMYFNKEWYSKEEALAKFRSYMKTWCLQKRLKIKKQKYRIVLR